MSDATMPAWGVPGEDDEPYVPNENTVRIPASEWRKMNRATQEEGLLKAFAALNTALAEDEQPTHGAEQIALRFYHRDTGADLGFGRDGGIPSEAAWAFLHENVWYRIHTNAAHCLWQTGVRSLNGEPVPGNVPTVTETPEEGEWPARDRVPRVTMDEFHEKTGGRFAVPIGMRPAEVTDEMRRAANALDWGLIVDRDHRCADVYRAMHAAARVPLVSDAEIALTRERDEAFAMRNETMAALTAMKDERDEARAELAKERDWTMRLGVDHTSLTEENRLFRAELMAARDQLAKFTAQNVVEPEAPDPIANAIRPRAPERRRVGG